MNKMKGLVLAATLFATGLTLSACGNEDNATYARAVFYLEGGECQNNKEKVSYKYDVTNGDTYIVSPNDLKANDVTKAGYVLSGWYRTKTDEGYSDPWNFQTDKMTAEGVTLYAKWESEVKHTYDLYYKNDLGEDTLLYSYSASEGSKFNDILKKAKLQGKTLYRYADESGNTWDENYVHPGGENSVNVKVYAEFIDGIFEIVRTKDDLLKATSSNIYLDADIDMEGEELNFEIYSRKKFYGNNHKISNFNLKCQLTQDNALGNDTGNSNCYIALFKQISNSEIKDVTFENMTAEVKGTYSRIDRICVMPFAAGVVNSTISNVTISGSVLVTTSITTEIITDRAYYAKDDSSTVDVDYQNLTITK